MLYESVSHISRVVRISLKSFITLLFNDGTVLLTTVISNLSCNARTINHCSIAYVLPLRVPPMCCVTLFEASNRLSNVIVVSIVMFTIACFVYINCYLLYLLFYLTFYLNSLLFRYNVF